VQSHKGAQGGQLEGSGCLLVAARSLLFKVNIALKLDQFVGTGRDTGWYGLQVVTAIVQRTMIDLGALES
jgi:hypothetical protein